MKESRQRALASAGALVLRVGLGGLMVARHGAPKLASFGDRVDSFADPLGVGPAASLVLAIFAEFLCSVLLVLGLATRLAAIPLVVTMLVAAFVVHADDPFGKVEFPLIYAIGFTALALSGAGDWSIDARIARRRKG